MCAITNMAGHGRRLLAGFSALPDEDGWREMKSRLKTLETLAMPVVYPMETA